jgi:hypothetical protein
LDAHLIKVATGQIIGEKVSGKNDKHIEAMIKLLANNFIFELTGSGERKTSDKLKEYKSTWAIFTTGSLVALTTSFHFAYNYNYDKYHQTHQLDKFDFYYDRANQYYKTRNLLMVATSISALTSFILWQSDMSEGNRIFANHNQAPELCSQNNFALIISPHGDGCYVSLRLQL